MDTYHTAFGLTLLSNNKPLTLEAWNARYEAMSFERDWWFKAAAAVLRWVHSRIASAPAVTATPMSRAAHA
jgi:hypothetical protein